MIENLGPQLWVVLPELLLALGAMALLMLGAFRGQRTTGIVTGLAVVLLIVVGILVLRQPGGQAFGGSFIADSYARFLKILAIIGSVATLVMSAEFLSSPDRRIFEYAILVLLSTLGMLVLISAGDLITLYLGLELMSLALYVVAASHRDNVKSTEAGLKYFVLGALSSGMLLYGASLIYGFTGTVSFAGIAAAAKTGSVGIIFGLVFLFAGLCFKVSAVPFHMWTPDVYEGAPTPVTAFFASAPKVAALAVFARVALTAFPGITFQWQQIIVFVSIASMALGSFAAIGQTNIKRLMAYSSIGHMGFALVGLAAGTVEGAQGVLTYIAIYVAMTLGSFAVIMAIKRNGQSFEKISDFAGLSRTNPLLAFFFAMLLFSLAGIPPLAGFFAKWYVFVAAIKAGLFALSVIGVLTSVVGAYYYLLIVKTMYFDEPLATLDPVRVELRTVLAISGIFNILFFAYPGPLVSAAAAAAKSLFQMPFALGARAAARGYGLVVFDQAGSTNIEALAAARQGARAPCWFVTTEQTAGRGRRQRPWVAPRGNLASSVLEVLNVAPVVAATLGFAACLAIENALRQVSREAVLRSGGSSALDFAVKWPNDVLAGGRKIVGMLLEAEQVAGGLAVVAGIGTNVVAAPTDTPTPAVSLRDLGVEVSAEDLFSALSESWVEYFGIWNEGRGFADIRRLWLERAAGLGQPVAIRSGHAIIEGIFDTIDEQGCMLVRTAEGRLEPITAGDVHFGSVASKGAVQMARPDELTFAPLGGVGEIGMNLSIYGLGNRHQRSWLAIDLGVSFGDEEHLPGIDLIMPDVAFLEKERNNLVGLVLTHAHEDHFGAIIDLWPRLKCPIYATKFSAALFEAKCEAERLPAKIPVTVIPSGGRVDIGPFNVEFIPVAHSIPESHALAIHTEVGTVLHTGDWKIDPTPVLGAPTDEKRLRELGDAGLLALIGDSTNAVREGRSPSEAEVAKTIAMLVKEAKGRVAVTTFASNVARIRAVADAAREAEREVVIVGRAMERVVQVARETGYLDGVQNFRGMDLYGHFPADKVLALCTGSQGEARAALARIANDDHPLVTLNKGDTVIFSSRTIPGNEKAVGAVINGLVQQGIEIITDRNHLVHVSGHPRRDELRDMIAWTRPQLLIPVHGEALHLHEHARLARACGVPKVITCRNGDLVKLGPGEPGIIDELPAGRLYKDGSIVEDAKSRAVVERRKMAFAGCIFVALAITEKGELADDPEVDMVGIPEKNAAGEEMDDIVFDAVVSTFEGLPRARRRDPDAAAESVRRAVRAAVNEQWGKKPICLVHVLEV